MKTGRILCHPFHNGLEGVGMGAGPSRLLGDAAFVDELRAADWRIETIEAPQAADPEIVRIAEADRRLARRVRAAAEGGLSLLQLEEAIDLVFGSFEVAAAAITRVRPRGGRGRTHYAPGPLPVEARATRTGSKSSRRGSLGGSSSSASSRKPVAACATRSTSQVVDVRGGASRREIGCSPNPATDTSAGIARPSSAQATQTPYAIESDRQNMAVGRSGADSSSRASGREPLSE